MKRIFIAIKVDPGQNLLNIHNSLKSILGEERINWTDTANIHVTLAFLGNTEDELIKVVSILLRQECEGFGDFRFKISGTGVFKNYLDSKVIWAGIEHNEKLILLNNQILDGLKDAGFKIETRQFNPHITLGRIKSISNPDLLKSTLGKYKDAKIQEVDVKDVILFESILKPSGPVYKSIGGFSLK